jgi:DNA-directed RNA polymerase subunit M/transcription elongation factor TFIIS
MTADSLKLCFFCGVDCASIPHVTDRSGKYACRACADSAKARALAAKKLAASPAIEATDNSEIEVAPLDMSSLHRAPCPKCGVALVAGIPGCSACGYRPEERNVALADRPPSKKPRSSKSLKCKTCGYDLTGLKGGKCPECGNASSTYSRREWDEETSREVARNAYMKAAIVGAIGLLMGWGAILAKGSFAGMIGFPITCAISSAIGIAVCMACCAAWIGFTSSFLLMSAQVTGIHCVAIGLMTLVVVLSGGMVFQFGLSGAAYVYLMSDMLEMDRSDARLVSLACVATHVALIIGAHSIGLF